MIIGHVVIPTYKIMKSLITTKKTVMYFSMSIMSMMKTQTQTMSMMTLRRRRRKRRRWRQSWISYAM